MRSLLTASAATLLLAACGDSGGRIEAPPDVTPEDVAATDAVAAENRLIADARMGPFAIGMSFADMQATDESFDYEREAVANGINRLCAMEDGAPVVCGYAAQGRDAVYRLETRDGRFRTLQGVAVGVSLDVAAEVYGDAFVIETDSGEELVEFDRGPRGGVMFYVAAEGGAAGVYEEDAAEGAYRETEDYLPSAAISMIAIDIPPAPP